MLTIEKPKFLAAVASQELLNSGSCSVKHNGQSVMALKLGRQAALNCPTMYVYKSEFL